MSANKRDKPKKKPTSFLHARKQQSTVLGKILKIFLTLPDRSLWHKNERLRYKLQLSNTPSFSITQQTFALFLAEESDEDEDEENSEESVEDESEEDLTDTPKTSSTQPPYSLVPRPPVWVQHNQGLSMRTLFIKKKNIIIKSKSKTQTFSIILL